MCTMIAHQVKLEGRGKSGPQWFEVCEANVSYDHPYDLPLEHALNIDFVNEAMGPGARLPVELMAEAGRRGVEVSFADFSVTKKLAGEVDRGLLVGIEVGQGAPLANVVDDVVPDAGLSRGSGVRVPDEGAAHLPGHRDHDDLLHLL